MTFASKRQEFRTFSLQVSKASWKGESVLIHSGYEEHFQDDARKMQKGIGMKSRGHHDSCRHCYIFAETREQMFNIMKDANVGLKMKGLQWKEEQMELISWVLHDAVGDLS